jgi:hypothetical protein
VNSLSFLLFGRTFPDLPGVIIANTLFLSILRAALDQLHGLVGGSCQFELLHIKQGLSIDHESYNAGPAGTSQSAHGDKNQAGQPASALAIIKLMDIR